MIWEAENYVQRIGYGTWGGLITCHRPSPSFVSKLTPRRLALAHAFNLINLDVSLWCHTWKASLTQHLAVAAQNSVTLSNSTQPLIPNSWSYAAHELSETQLSHIQLTMDRLQRQDLQARPLSPFATQFDMSEQVSLPFVILQASVSAIHSIGQQQHLWTLYWLPAVAFSILTFSPKPFAPSRPASSCSTMNPSARVFTSDPTPPPRTTANELCVVNQSLCKALAEARQALRASQLALEEETNKRAKAEEEAKSLLRTISSLASTAQMLGAIITYNINTNTKLTPTEAVSTVLPEGNTYVQVSIYPLVHPSLKMLTRDRSRRIVTYRTS
jgi:hypothetical protein